MYCSACPGRVPFHHQPHQGGFHLQGMARRQAGCQPSPAVCLFVKESVVSVMGNVLFVVLLG